jgi:ferritin-like metal-binding protein YciE
MTIAGSIDVFFDQLKDLKSALSQVADTLPDLIAWAEQRSLRSLLEDHRISTIQSLFELNAIFENHAVDPGEDLCKAMAGLIQGGNQHLEMAADGAVRDILLVAHTRRIAGYVEAAAEFTVAIARNCSLLPEADAVARIHAFEREFTKRLQLTGMETYGVELGGFVA